MFEDSDLEDAFSNSHTLRISSLILAEFNLNDLDNFSRIGNYRYRPFGTDGQFLEPISTYDEFDTGDYYTDAEVSYKEYSDTEDTPFTVVDKTKNLYYSLGDCFLPFRPRSGINKAKFMGGKYIDNIRSGERPRYYMASRNDYFKYWSSHRTEDGIERGISTPTVTSMGGYGIDDACPFIVYKEPINANRIVIKVQTNVGSVDLGQMRTPSDIVIDDPLFAYSNATVPQRWKIQVLKQNSWVDAIEFNENSSRLDGSPIFPKDGHVEIFYGIKVPAEFATTFTYLGQTITSLLPNLGILTGYAYVVDDDTKPEGILKIWDGSEWQSFGVEYGWSLHQDDIVETNGTITEPSNPPYYTVNGENVFREFTEIKGIRIVAKTMNSSSSSLDVIEISPRLMVNISNYVESFSVTKSIANEGMGLPVGSLSVSNGSINITNFNNIFTEANVFNGLTGSIIAEYARQNTKFIIYETILNINGFDKYVPIKTFYAEEFPKPSGGDSTISIPLRDLFFRLETTNAPSVLTQETTLTYAISTTLDYIGFSNYSFRNITSANDPILPFFFIEPNVSVAEILQRLAVATQTAMFFDEYNNFIVMSKEYLLPSVDDRATNMILLGNDDAIANIQSISDSQTKIINSGQIDYTIRYIQREVSSLSSTVKLDSERMYRYKPVLLWEVAATDETKTINEASKVSSGYTLGAMALNNVLTASAPYVSNHEVVDNVIDFGESIYWLPRFQGYLYANGEIIRFDAVEYSVPSSSSPVVWISSNQEYQKYFGALSFNGKMFPTGRVRIYSEPYYEEANGITILKNGNVRVHGRNQFGTEITSHSSGLASYWSNNDNTYGVRMYSELLFSTTPTESIVNPTISDTVRVEVSTTNDLARKSKRNGIIKNFMSSKVFSDGVVNDLSVTQSGTVQSSAFVVRGPLSDTTVPNPRDLVSYVYKDLSNNFSFRSFGTRMRIIGRVDRNFGQVANGSSNYFSVQSQTSSDAFSINGGSAGIAIMVNPTNGSGYYFEIAALTETNIKKYITIDSTGQETSIIHNIIFYKVNKNVKTGDSASSPATPIKLWGGLSNILVDSGLFVGQDRIGVTEDSTVYDLSIEYETLSGGGIKFYLYINNILVQIVNDTSPLPINTTAALFVRGSTECMFENLYALEDLVAKNTNSQISQANNVFDENGISTSEFLRKYAISGMVQSTYLTGISPDTNTQYKVYFEEFGTIMRECAHFNIKYDLAYPSFYSKIAKTYSNDRGYTISKFYGGAYESEFLIFNSSDKAIVLDETTGNYLRILGITFTQNTTQTLSVDKYFNKLSNASDPVYQGNEITSPNVSMQKYNKIKASRSRYGSKEFSLNSMYIQSEDAANSLMGWVIDKTMAPRRQMVIETFALPHLQLGDIVTIDYTMPGDIEYVDPTTRFVVQDISYSRALEGPNQSIKVVEII